MNDAVAAQPAAAASIQSSPSIQSPLQLEPLAVGGQRDVRRLGLEQRALLVLGPDRLQRLGRLEVLVELGEHLGDRAPRCRA